MTGNALTPQIEILGVIISEPMTLLTDYVITLVAGWFGLRLLVATSEGACLARRAWGIAFLLIALGAFLGGTAHGFRLDLNDAWRVLIGKGTVYSIGLSALFAVAGTLRGTPISTTLGRFFNVSNLLAFSAYAIWMITNDGFEFVIYYYVPAMILIAGVQMWALVKHRASSAKWLVSGVIITLASAYIQQSDINLHRNFNHNDLYHVMQIAGLYLLFRGAKELRAPITSS